jgi:hypothetical protein
VKTVRDRGGHQSIADLRARARFHRRSLTSTRSDDRLRGERDDHLIDDDPRNLLPELYPEKVDQSLLTRRQPACDRDQPASGKFGIPTEVARERRSVQANRPMDPDRMIQTATDN